MTFQDRTTHFDPVSEEPYPPLPVLRQKRGRPRNPIAAAAVVGTVLVPVGVVTLGLTALSNVMKAEYAHATVTPPLSPAEMIARVGGITVLLLGFSLQVFALVAGLIRERFRRVPTSGLLVLVFWVVLLVVAVLGR